MQVKLVNVVFMFSSKLHQLYMSPQETCLLGIFSWNVRLIAFIESQYKIQIFRAAFTYSCVVAVAEF